MLSQICATVRFPFQSLKYRYIKLDFLFPRVKPLLKHFYMHI